MKAPHGYAAVVATFGDARDSNFQDRNIVSVPIPFTLRYRDDENSPWVSITRVRVHHLIASSVVAALTTIWIYARLQVKESVGYDKTTEEYDKLTHAWLAERHLDEYGGAYNFRNVRGSATHLSMHAFGIALDFAPETYPRGSSKRMPDWWIKAWEDQGFFYGGDFQTTKDGMHVQMAVGT